MVLCWKCGLELADLTVCQFSVRVAGDCASSTRGVLVLCFRQFMLWEAAQRARSASEGKLDARGSVEPLSSVHFVSISADCMFVSASVLCG